MFLGADPRFVPLPEQRTESVGTPRLPAVPLQSKSEVVVVAVEVWLRLFNMGAAAVAVGERQKTKNKEGTLGLTITINHAYRGLSATGDV